MWWEIIKVFFPLIVLTGLLYLLLRYVRRFGITPGTKRSKAVEISVISAQMIMPKKYISVVKVDNKVLVLGVAESITLLKELDEDSIVDVDSGKELPAMDLMTTIKRNFGFK